MKNPPTNVRSEEKYFQILQNSLHQLHDRDRFFLSVRPGHIIHTKLLGNPKDKGVHFFFFSKMLKFSIFLSSISRH